MIFPILIILGWTFFLTRNWYSFNIHPKVKFQITYGKYVIQVELVKEFKKTIIICLYIAWDQKTWLGDNVYNGTRPGHLTIFLKFESWVQPLKYVSCGTDLIGGGIGFVDGVLNYLLTLLVLHGRINQQIPGGTRSEWITLKGKGITIIFLIIYWCFLYTNQTCVKHTSYKYYIDR